MQGLTLFHIVAGSAALAAGGAALVVRKGGPVHARVGTIFFATMIAMAASGAIMAALKPERGTALIGLLTCYLVATSWHTARSREGLAGAWERASLAVALALFAAMLTFSLQAASSPNGRLDSLPAAAHYPFVLVAALAALFDLLFLIRGRLEARQRIARHLWRMCTALLIAAFSFFLGQQDEFPASIKGLFVQYLPPLAVMATMLYWIFRMRFGRGLARRRRSPAARSARETVTTA